MDAIQLLMTGDINCKRDGVLSEKPLAQISDELSSADVRIGNLEGAFYDSRVGLDYKPGWFHCEPDMVSSIDGYFDAVACANNVHNGPAIEPSGNILDQVGILHTGAGRNATEARRPAIIERNGVKVGLLAYTSIFWPLGHVATADTAGVAAIRNSTSYEPHPRLIEMPGAPAFVRSQPNSEDMAQLRDDIQRLRGEVDVLVVYCHWGVTGSDEIAEYQQAIGRQAIEAGADIVAGAHPHIPQGIEFYQRGVILYSLGNFMFGWKLHQEMTSDGLIARVDIRKGEPWALSVVPVRRTSEGEIVSCVPGSPDGDRIGNRVARLSKQYGTVFEPVVDRFLIHDDREEGRRDLGLRE